MTECERIIAEGILPKSFFEEEVRNDFLVTKERKKIWAVELDLLLAFDKVCQKNKLKYYLAYGTLLGAVRHHGIIPWDDDIDVWMMREDYDKLMHLAEEFSEPYFFQTPCTDPESGFSFIKIRNSNTTGISKLFRHQEMNHGLFLDVFPLDVLCLNGRERQYEKIYKLNMENSTYMRMKNPFLEQMDLERVSKWEGKKPGIVFEEIEAIAKKDSMTESPYLALSVATLFDFRRQYFEKCDFDTIEYCTVEGISLPIPRGFDRILKCIYGDYMQLPPIEERGIRHNGAIFDADIPYWKYQGDFMINE